MTSRTDTIRCAKYLRVSTVGQDHGEFTSVKNQDEACEASITSLKTEGCVSIPEPYSDVGVSGATLDRPGLNRLIADIEAELVDRVVVYKLDRLSRSLADFVKLIEIFDAHDVTLASVTQPFNTGDTTGRLMLNILLSFAQFERETIADRTRDKIRAARRKGYWTGGSPPLGYDVHPQGGSLIVNVAEAEQVLEIYRHYLRLKSLQKTCTFLAQRGLTLKCWTTRGGHQRGGGAFTKPSLRRLLTSPIYIGMISCGDEVHDGQHDAIVPADLFEEVQSLLGENRRTRGSATRNIYGFLLRGRVTCSACRASRISSTTRKGSRAYKYYVCSSAQRHGYETCPCPSVPAFKLEGLILDQIRTVGRDQDLQDQVLAAARTRHEEVRERLDADLARATKKRAATQDEIKGLLKTLADGAVSGTSITGRIAELETALETLDHQVADIQAQIESHAQLHPDPFDLAESLTVFDEIWDVLLPAEKERVISLLIDTIDYDGTTLGIEFSPAGVKLLSEELKLAHGA